MPHKPLLPLAVVGLLLTFSCTKDPVQDDLFDQNVDARKDDSKDFQGVKLVDGSLDEKPGEDSSADMNSNSTLGGSCTGTCASTSLQASFGGSSPIFTNAFYGLTAANKSSSGEVEIYIESYVDGSSGCPSQNSPTPAMTLIVSGLAVPSTTKPLTQADVTVKLLDFDGSTLGEGNLIADPTSVSLTPKGLSVCETCLGDPNQSDQGFVSLNMKLAFDGGTIEGQLYATHCDSMDES